MRVCFLRAGVLLSLLGVGVAPGFALNNLVIKMPGYGTVTSALANIAQTDAGGGFVSVATTYQSFSAVLNVYPWSQGIGGIDYYFQAPGGPQSALYQGQLNIGEMNPFPNGTVFTIRYHNGPYISGWAVFVVGGSAAAPVTNALPSTFSPGAVSNPTNSPMTVHVSQDGVPVSTFIIPPGATWNGTISSGNGDTITLNGTIPNYGVGPDGSMVPSPGSIFSWNIGNVMPNSSGAGGGVIGGTPLVVPTGAGGGAVVTTQYAGSAGSGGSVTWAVTATGAALTDTQYQAGVNATVAAIAAVQGTVAGLASSLGGSSSSGSGSGGTDALPAIWTEPDAPSTSGFSAVTSAPTMDLDGVSGAAAGVVSQYALPPITPPAPQGYFGFTLDFPDGHGVSPRTFSIDLTQWSTPISIFRTIMLGGLILFWGFASIQLLRGAFAGK